ncbi:hypothetical protein LY76DRAFT_129059 [Colletotrichum caudatum]|nr:hypothetical protein LY76DRAFT_129059 [Colletotrichum caudatum]
MHLKLRIACKLSPSQSPQAAERPGTEVNKPCVRIRHRHTCMAASVFASFLLFILITIISSVPIAGEARGRTGKGIKKLQVAGATRRCNQCSCLYEYLAR